MSVKATKCGHYTQSWDYHPLCSACRSCKPPEVDRPGVYCDICSKWSDDQWKCFLGRRSYKDRPYVKAKRLPSPKVLISPLKGHHSVAPQGPTINPLTRRSVPQEKRSNSPGAKSSLSAPLSRDVASQKQKQGRALSVTSLESEPSFRPSFGRKGPRLVTQAAPSGETLPPSGVTPLGTSGQGSRPVPRSLAPRSGPIPPLWGPDGIFSGQGFIPPP